MIRPLLYLRIHSLRNRLTASARRLRNPKYLLSFLVGVAYVYFIFLRRIRVYPHGPNGSVDPAFIPTEAIVTVGAAILLVVFFVMTAFSWFTGATEARLKFTEAEVAFLFPAPMSRQRLIHFNLLGTQFSILVSSVILTVILHRWSFLGGNSLTRAVGWWLILSSITLFGTALSFGVAKMMDLGGRAVRRRGLILLAFLLLSAVRSFWVHSRPPDSATLVSVPLMARYVTDLIEGGFGHAVLVPFEWVIRPFASPTVGAFFKAIGPGLVVPLVCYLITAQLQVSFREGSIAVATRRALVRASRRTAGTAAGAPRMNLKPRRSPFRMAARGRPEVAFLWKNLIGIQAWFNLRIFLILIGFATVAAINLRTAAMAGPRSYAPIVLGLAAFAAFYTMLLGPQLVRQDLRSDLLNADILKTYPLSGWQIVGGQMLTPALLLAGILWLTVLVAGWAIFSGFGPAQGYSFGTKVAFLSCIGVVIPPVVCLQLVIPNGAALLFPAWHQTVRNRTAGIEVIGQRLIFVFGQFLVVVIALLPAALLAALIAWASAWILGPITALILATAAVLVIVLGEVWVGLWWLGKRFEVLDIATELRP